MFRRILLVGLVVGFPLALLYAGEPDLWQKAVETAAQNRNWVPGEAYTRAEMLDKKGKVKHIQESLLRLTPEPDGQVKTEIVRVLEDGEDKTADAKKKQQEQQQQNGNRKGAHTFRIGRSPFLPEVQDSVKVQPLDSAAVIDGKQCVAFHFEQQVGRAGTIVGTAWLDAASGVPVVLDFERRPLPNHVKKMRTRIRYKYTPKGEWYPVEMTVSGEASFLIVKKRFRSVVRLSKHWKLKEAEKGNSN